MQIFRTKLTVSPQLYLCGAIVLLIFPIKWICAWLAAAFVHELFHYIALLVCDTQILNIELGVGGAKMHTGSISGTAELICALAGPIGSLLLLAISRWFPYVAVCGFLQGMYNLLPLFPLDGGRATVCLLQMFFGTSTAGEIYTGIKAVVFAALLFLALLAIKNSFGPIPLLFAIILFIRMGMENPLANRRK